MSESRVIIEDHSRAIATFSLTLRTGLLHDPPGRPGVAYVTGQMLLRGAGDRTQADIADELDFLGSVLSVGVGRDTITIEGDALIRNLDAFQALMADVLTRPTFPTEELEKVKRQVLAELVQVRDHDPSLGRKHYVHAVYGDHPYGWPLRGHAASISSLTRDDLVAFYETNFRAGGALVGSAGDVTPERVDALVVATLGQLPQDAPRPFDVATHTDRDGYRVVLVDKPERSQTQVYIGQTTLDSRHPDFIPLFVGNTIFGGTFTARLSHEIREKRGWSYGAYSYLQTDRRLGTWLMRFYPGAKDTVPALKVADELLRGMLDEGATADELEATRSYLINSTPMSIETPEKELQERLSALLHGRPLKWLEQFVEQVREVTLDEVNAALKRHLSLDNQTICVVCTADDIRGDLEAWGRAANITTVAYDQEHA